MAVVDALLSKRHKASCPHKDDKHYRRCCRSIWIETHINSGKAAKTTQTANWEDAPDKARAIENAHLNAELGRGPAPSKAKTLAAAIQLFMDSKRGEDLAENTLYTHTLTLNRLRDLCERHGVFFVNDITLSQLTWWRAAWPFEPPEYKAVLAAIPKSGLMLRNQARVKACMSVAAFLLRIVFVCPRMSC